MFCVFITCVTYQLGNVESLIILLQVTSMLLTWDNTQHYKYIGKLAFNKNKSKCNFKLNIYSSM